MVTEPPGDSVDGFARADVGRPPDAPVAPTSRLCGRLDIGAGGGSGPVLRIAGAGWRGRRDREGRDAARAARAPEGRGELVDVSRPTSGPARHRRGRGGRSRG